LVHDVRSYAAEDIHFGMRYADDVFVEEDGTAVADLTRIGALEPDVGEQWEHGKSCSSLQPRRGMRGPATSTRRLHLSLQGGRSLNRQTSALLTVLISAAGVLAGLERPLLLVALVLWLGGGALYLWIVTLIFFRYTFIHMAPEDLTPPYWINMGAVAISTLVGATLIEHTALSRDVAEIAPFVTGCTLVFWAIATWWIPMLLVLGVWRYLICGLPVAYDPLHWGGVFPLGMYSVATYHLAKILAAPFLLPLSWLFMVIAVLAWAATFAGLVDSRLNRLWRPQSSD
jgi:hypothetical protein